MYNFENSKYFESREFDSRDVPGSGKNMQAEFMQRLEGARLIAGIPFVINSGFRTRQRNKAVGGAADSTHLTGWAADISTKTDLQFETILNACMLAGFERFGLMETAIHVDCHPIRPVSVWIYDQRSPEQNNRMNYFQDVWEFYLTARKNKLIR
jgi:zinc D-Ala-D-Ala carboxypeptidase